jgi:dTDP-4-dehydrorhamnose reductase
MLIIGGSGLVGSNLARAARETYEVFATFNAHRMDQASVEELHVDVRDYQQVSSVVKAVSPEVVVHTAALMDVDLCQKDAALAREVNTMGSRHVARAVGSRALLVYISTDYVFDGKTRTPYVESDPTGPVNVYGETKLGGEEEVRANAQEFLIVRPAQIWGENFVTRKPTLVQKILASAKSGEVIELLSDQKQSPTYAAQLAHDVLDLVKAGERGVFHAAGASALSRFEVGVKVAEAYDLDASSLRPVKLAAAGLAAPRPANVALSSGKLAGVLGRQAPSFDASLKQFRATVPG